MSNWVTWRVPPKRTPLPEYTGRRPRPYGRTAGHIRGRVFLIRPACRDRHALWGMEVINTRTGDVIASDNCTIREAIVDLCDEATAAARAAWFWSFTKKKVSP